MKYIIKSEELLANKNFIPWFLLTSFPEGINNTKEISLIELIQEEYIIDKEWIDWLTGYYDKVFDENDGYVDEPKAIEFKLSNGDVFSIEFHPGDTIYYLNDKQIGCTGPSYKIRNISLSKFHEFTNNMDDKYKVFLLPMVKIESTEEEFF